MTPGTFTIGEAAARAGISADTIRYYERIGVLPKPPRSAAGYRRYSDAHVGRMVFVRNAARFGFPLKELAGFLKSREKGQLPCRSVRAAGVADPHSRGPHDAGLPVFLHYPRLFWL